MSWFFDERGAARVEARATAPGPEAIRRVGPSGGEGRCVVPAPPGYDGVDRNQDIPSLLDRGAQRPAGDSITVNGTGICGERPQPEEFQSWPEPQNRCLGLPLRIEWSRKINGKTKVPLFGEAPQHRQVGKVAPAAPEVPATQGHDHAHPRLIEEPRQPGGGPNRLRQRLVVTRSVDGQERAPR